MLPLLLLAGCGSNNSYEGDFTAGELEQLATRILSLSDEYQWTAPSGATLEAPFENVIRLLPDGIIVVDRALLGAADPLRGGGGAPSGFSDTATLRYFGTIPPPGGSEHSTSRRI